MPFPKVAREGLAVPTGPTGILASGKRGAKKVGGSRDRGGKKGLGATRGQRLMVKGRR